MINGIIDADTHISEGADMWAMMDKVMYPRRPVLAVGSGRHLVRQPQCVLADRRRSLSKAGR